MTTYSSASQILVCSQDTWRTMQTREAQDCRAGKGLGVGVGAKLAR